MKIGFIISVYDEYDVTYNNLLFLKKNSIPVVLIQSDPNDKQKEIDSSLVDHYEILSDLAGSREIFQQESKIGKIDPDKLICKPLGRNFSHAFNAAKKFDVDWWIIIIGDVTITNLNGIKKIIQNMTKKKKTFGITRGVGQTYLDINSNPTRIQKIDTRDFIPTFFIVNGNLVKKGIFSNIQITNPYSFEQSMGDNATDFFEKNKLEFFNETFVICDYAYPQFIDGLKYNPDRITLPRYFDGMLNCLRKLKMKFS